jgi:hypothetical protein
MWTFSCFNGVETVAVGFWALSRYSGPTHCEGAVGRDSVDMLMAGHCRNSVTIEGYRSSNSQLCVISCIIDASPKIYQTLEVRLSYGFVVLTRRTWG